MRVARQTLRAVFAMPLLLALASIVGLVSALAGDGIEDVVAWITLALPVLAVAWAMRVRRF